MKIKVKRIRHIGVLAFFLVIVIVDIYSGILKSSHTCNTIKPIAISIKNFFISCYFLQSSEAYTLNGVSTAFSPFGIST